MSGNESEVSPAHWGTVHLIAIGGAGMSVIAQLLLDRGVRVQGSDAQDSPTLRALAKAGARVWVGHDAAHLAGVDTVVVSSAIKADNVELRAAKDHGLSVLHRSEALARLSADHVGVAVAGAHGKTTTSAMIATALVTLGAEPSYAIGSTLRTEQGAASGGHAGSGPVIVIEADESDGSFLAYAPRIAVVNNIEADHLDHYGSVQAFEDAFAQFADRVVPGGALITSADDDGARRLTERLSNQWVGEARAERAIITCGQDAGADYRLTRIELPGRTGLAAAQVLTPDGQTVTLELQVPGKHNLQNATVALAAGVSLGYPAAQFAAALGDFRGTGRRFETRGVVAGVRVIDDYAHHPTEVAAVLTAAREINADGRVLALFQPHLYSRTEKFAHEFAAALDLADFAVICDVYRAREDPRTDVGPQTIADQASAESLLAVVPDLRDAALVVAREARPGDMILLVGAGDVTSVADLVLSELSARRESS